MKTAVIAALAALSACTHADRVAVLSASAVTLTFCDVRQTLNVSCGGRWDCPARDGYYYQESNPLLGSAPGAPKLVTAFGLVYASTLWVAVTDKIPTWGKYALLGTLVAGEAYEVSRMTPLVGACGGRQ